MLLCAMLTITELNRQAESLIRQNRKLQLLLTEGEIANLHREDSGHLFFSLRDEKSAVRAVMFAHLAERLRFQPENGLQVIAAANADFYPVSGTFQLRVTDMLLQGIGTVQRGFLRKEQELQKEGILSASGKKPLPENPRKIGIITSAQGAALQDILHILKRRSPLAETVIFPVHVQGIYAEAEICQALKAADSQQLDVLILGRGGGSAEDLAIFNAESVVRTVSACHTPVISAVGHETDVTLTDKAADLRASTPSAAAELATSPHFPEMQTLSGERLFSVRQIPADGIFRIILPDGSVTVRAFYQERKFIMNDNEKLRQYAVRTEQKLASVVDGLSVQAQQRQMTADSLFHAMRHSLTAGGKRIRPALIYAFCELCGSAPEKADAAAAAMEMTHTSSLIFDDLPAMDNDDFRRGKPSCHKAFGEATAMLAGIGLICAPFQIIAEDNALTPEQKTKLIQILATEEGTAGMVGGQMLDMLFETAGTVTAEQLEMMCLGKTGALMKASCQMGIICGGGSAEQVEAAGNYGLATGLAFQMVDDILDVTSTSEQLGKPVGSDAEEGKQTFVTLLGIAQAKNRAAELTAKAHTALDKFPESETRAFLHSLTDALLVRVQ